MMKKSLTLHSRIIDITEDYLGPAADRFISRIATNHLGKSASALDHQDLPELITWVQMAASVMTENSEAVEQYVDRLRTLQDNHAPARQHASSRYQYSR